MERASAHVALAPGHLGRASAYLDGRRAAARENEAFAERMVAETKGVMTAEAQARSAQSVALNSTRFLVIETVDLARKIAEWEVRKASLEKSAPKSGCG